MSAPVKIPTTQLRPRLGARVVDKVRAKALAASIADIGLRTPITVRGVEAIDDGRKAFVYQIIAGRHRYEACCQLGWTEIDAFVTEDDDTHAALWEIDENLMRAELSPADRATLTARRKWYYEELHPETKHESFKGNQHTPASRQVGDNQPNRFTADTASKTGKSERAVQRDATRGERIEPAVLERIHGTPLDKGAYLDRLAKLEPEKQAQKVERDLSEPEPPRVTAEKSVKQASAKTPKHAEPTAVAIETTPGQFEMQPQEKLQNELNEIKALLAKYSYQAQKLAARWVLEQEAGELA